MSDGVIVVLISVGGSVLIGLLTVIFARRGTSESNETKKLELLINGQGDRITSLESEVKELKADKDKIAEELEVEKKKRDKEIQQIKDIVRRWIVKIEARWYAMTDDPMPTPSTEELELLDIALPIHKPRKTAR